ncbi:hypothetical protein DLM45_13570 [Hyphomicrobium methylovorum]|uniref:hypothetical protein n=1 Tax=Hyphomicrobium methylovorum TaxID=84 RepID=UPI0015E6D807|nr:hypothetical protein [Hyphomicrobium methylovorum]MBA2127244.1 hypothetical protein [Hyphomicrobium methylovorum]
MQRPLWSRAFRLLKRDAPAKPQSLRDRIAKYTALGTLAFASLAFILSNGTQLLMPGPLTSAHSSIKNCYGCHAQSGNGKVSWIQGLIPGEPHADSKACLTCHNMPETAFNPHGASVDVLKQSTARLMKVVSNVPASARAQSIAFPTNEMVSHGLSCATCHQEHQGANFKLNKISNEQCRSCHVVKFDSFDGQHPKFDGYPFKRRTRIVYDHAEHFNKHYPEVAKKDRANLIPATCSTCHNSRDDRRIMAVAPFEKTCAACHLDQITGKERATGPKGIAFLSLPGIDMQSLKDKKASIGEWPSTSEAELTPFMQIMIGRTARGRAILKTTGSLNLQDLSRAKDSQIAAVTNLVWEIKSLFNSLILGKGSDVLADLNISGGAKLSTDLVTALTASIPRDVLVSAQQQWLPNLPTEMANLRVTGDQKDSSWIAMAPQATPAVAVSEDAPEKSNTANNEPGAHDETSPADTSDEAGSQKAANKANKLDTPPCAIRILGQCLVAGKTETASSKHDTDKDTSSAAKRPPAMRAGLKSVAPAVDTESDAENPVMSNSKAKPTQIADNQTPAKSADQSDDLLYPNESERREIKALNKGIKKPAEPDLSVPGAKSFADTAANTQTQATPIISIDSGVDPESWAQYGGWYRQDYAIFYRPTGHKDRFIYSWLFITGPQAPKGNASPAAAVFESLIGKDAQGSCTKCHSVDDIQTKGRLVNFAQSSAETKRGRFTTFAHQPHFSMTENRGCMTCHDLEKDRSYLKSYEQGNPHVFASNFGGVKKELCQTCHQSNMTRQDCLTCHKYHVNGVTSPIMSTRIPTP